MFIINYIFLTTQFDDFYFAHNSRAEFTVSFFSEEFVNTRNAFLVEPSLFVGRTLCSGLVDLGSALHKEMRLL